MVWIFSARKARRLQELERLRLGSRMANEDVTVFGEELVELHIDTLSTELDPEMREDYQRALDSYEQAKAALRGATTADDFAATSGPLEEGRFARACVLARRDGVDLPQRRDPCFFDPRHGPAATDVDWKPSGGVPRSIPVCRNDANRLANGELPQVRMLRTGAGLVPWYAAGAYVSGTGLATSHVHGHDASLTSKHIAEAHLRAASNPAGGMTGSGGGGMGI